MKFRYFHPYYMPELWDAQVKAGLINNDSGIRYCQSIDIDEKLKFNNQADVGGKFYNLVKENNFPFYIDRLQGGHFFEGYDYNLNLVKEYIDILGDKFYGFQMHEWMSNFQSDTTKLVNGKCPEPWTEENICRTLKRDFPYEHVFTEAMSAKEYAEVGHLTNISAYIDAMKNLFEKRQKYTFGKLLPCDSAILAYPLEFSLGAERIMPEIGQQTRNTSVQIAYARGMSKACKKEFGAYLEPWGGDPFSTCNYHRELKNEWNISNESFPFKSAGGNGGSSRSLQKRLQLYTFVAGGKFISEEWGLCNTFYDWNDFELTPYGKIKLDFIRFTEKYSDIGAPLAPIAAVIPKEIIALDDIDRTDNSYFSFAVDSSLSEKLGNMRKGLRYLFGFGKCFGNENGCLVNRNLPDAIDIVNEDYYDETKYQFAINLTGNDEFSRKHKCIELDEIKDALEKLLPCKISEGLQSIISKNSDGSYYLTIMNNTGISRSVEKGETTLREAEKTVKIEIKDNRSLTKLEGDATIELENGKYYVTVPAGEFFFGRF